LEEKARFCKLYDNSRFDSRVSRLRNFLHTGILPYTGFTFDSPEHQSYIYSIYICASVQFTTECTVLYCTSDCAASPKVLLSSRSSTHSVSYTHLARVQDRQSFRYIYYQLRFFYFAHFSSGTSSLLKSEGPPKFFGTLRYMQPVSALSPSFLSSSF
jgi:hypothetical protein